MLGTGIIVDGMVCKFSAKFFPDRQSTGYIYFDSEGSRGIPCTVEQYRKFVKDFSRKLHKAVKLMWLWLLVSMPVLAILEVSEIIPSNRVIVVTVILLPAPLLFAFVYPAYSAPRSLNRQSAATRPERSHVERMDARVLGINPTTTIMLFLICIGGFILDNYGNWSQITSNGNNLIYLAGILSSLFTLWRRREAVKRYQRALTNRKHRV